MDSSSGGYRILYLVLAIMVAGHAYAQPRPDTAFALWPVGVPGSDRPRSEPEISDDRRGGVLRLARVTDPRLECFRPVSDRANGASVIVCPGGGYARLAIDKEGYEVATWLAGLGYTAYVLQYRVPDDRSGALQDLRRALRLVRRRCLLEGLDPGKVAVMGFSAGGHLAARAATHLGPDLYPEGDAADSLSARPDAVMLLYPAYLDEGPEQTLSPDLRPGPATPPVFLFATADDTHSHSALVMGEALRRAGLPVELHLLPRGGHGYGMRSGNRAAEAWPPWAAAWLRQWLLERSP